MAAVVEREPEHPVARREHREVDGHVRLRAGVRLDVRVLGAEERLRALARQLLHLVDDLAAAVVALARVALGVLVRRRRADRLEHRRPGEVLGRDQLDLTALPLELAAERVGDLGVDLGETRRPKVLERLLRDRHVAQLLARGRASIVVAPRRSAPATRPSERRSASADERDRLLGIAGAHSRSTRRLGAGEVDHGRRPTRRARRRRARPRSPARIRAGTSSRLAGDGSPGSFALVAATAPTASSTCCDVGREARRHGRRSCPGASPVSQRVAAGRVRQHERERPGQERAHDHLGAAAQLGDALDQHRRRSRRSSPTAGPSSRPLSS